MHDWRRWRPRGLIQENMQLCKSAVQRYTRELKSIVVQSKISREDGDRVRVHTTYVRTYVRNSSHWRLRAARNESSRRLAARRARRAGQIAGTQQSLAGLRAGIVAAACVPRYTRSRSVTRSRDYSFWYHSRLYLLLRDQEPIFQRESTHAPVVSGKWINHTSAVPPLRFAGDAIARATTSRVAPLTSRGLVALYNVGYRYTRPRTFPVDVTAKRCLEKKKRISSNFYQKLSNR